MYMLLKCLPSRAMSTCEESEPTSPQPPIPSPRARTRPTPKPRTKPADEILTGIQFSSPLVESSSLDPHDAPRISFATSAEGETPEARGPYENVTVSSPPSYPPPPLPSEELYDQPKTPVKAEDILLHPRLSITSSNSSSNSLRLSTYENFTPISPSPSPSPQSQVYYENFTPRFGLDVPSSGRPSQSILMHFDPIMQNQFMDDQLSEDDFFKELLRSKTEEPAKQAPPKPPRENLERKTALLEAAGPSKEPSEQSVKKEDAPYGRINKLKLEINNHMSNFAAATAAAAVSSDASSTWYDVPEEVERREPRVTSMVPPIPTRIDSIPKEDLSKMPPSLLGESSICVSPPPPPLPVTKLLETQKRDSKRTSIFTAWKIKNILQKQTPGTVYSTVKSFSRPSFGVLDLTVTFSGILVQPGRDKTEWRVNLGSGCLKWISDKGQQELSLHNLTSIAAFTVQPSTATPNSLPTHCIEISYCADKRQEVQIFAAPPSHRLNWLQKILTATTNCFPSSLTSDFTIAGWLHIKEGVSGTWVQCWMLLKDRTLYYCVQAGQVLEADLRKARYIKPQSTDGLMNVFGCAVLELQGRSLYLQALSQTDTTRWERHINAAALRNGPALNQQQLTKEDVPVIVDKCINFVSQQGSTSEGIYRRSGTQSIVSKLLMEFAKDAWAVQLTRTNYSEHDVASALKRFFKELPDPFIPQTLSARLYKVAKCKDWSLEKKIRKYQHLLRSELSNIALVTSRRLFGHLHMLHLESKKNRMTASNLAAIWGVTLLRDQSLDEAQTQLMIDLISNYPRLYDVTSAELMHEMHMLTMLEKLHAATAQQTHAKPSGDLKVWVMVGEPATGDAVQISLTPHKTAGEVCAELDKGPEFMLQEFVLGGALRRPIHSSEKVFEAVVRWGYWDEEDRKDNQLVLAPCPLYKQILPLAKPPLAACSELKFADLRSKTFKPGCVFELSQGKLCYYKDRKFANKVGEWNVEDIIWYIGHERKRVPPTDWAISFIPKHNKTTRSKEQPFFACTMAGSSHPELLQWCAALFLAVHPDGL